MSDTSSTTSCPDAATLRALLDGTLPEAQQGTTQAHVDRCPTCEAALRQMTAGGESWIGMVEKLKGSGEEDPKLAAALERLKADDGSGGESSESATDPQRTLDFLQPADDPKLLGKLGRHEISEVVGWGGMGVVLKAYDPSLHRVVAVKVLASHLAHHAVARKRFIREAQAAAAVCHDNVVTIHAIEDGSASPAHLVTRSVSEGGRLQDVVPGTSTSLGAPPLADASGYLPKIIMQFVAGGSLQERIDQEAPLELKEILRIAMQTAAGLAAAHAQGVVHRDVKPANILLENGVQRVKLTDFGLARVMDDASLTLSGVIAGTPQYMAPEQAWGRDVDARADLFSLGAVMYAMCSGHSPFRARTTMAVLKRVCEDAPRPLRAINPDVPDWLVAIIEKLLAKNPEDRFQTATEVSELLGRWLAHVQQPNVVERPQSISARRGSPDPAALPDRRSPGSSRDANSEGDPRSNTGAGSGDPRTARVSPVTLARMWVPVSIFVATFVLVLMEWLFGWMVSPGSHRDTPHEIFFKQAVMTLGQVLLAGCCYGLFYIGWNTRGGRQCAAMSIVLGILAWTFAVAFDHLPGAGSQLFLFQSVICGGYLLAILVRLVSRHGRSLLDLPELSADHAATARRGSPDPAASPDRRSPKWSRDEDPTGDLRSSPGAGSGDPRTAQTGQVETLPLDRAVRGRLNLKQTHWPVLITVAVLSVYFVLIVNETGAHNLSAYSGFCLVHLALTFALCSAFYSAWNTSSWLVWSGAMLFLPVASGTAFLSSSNGSVAQKVLNSVQLVVAFGFLFALMFIRPLFVRGSGKWMSERLTGWQQLFAIACFTIIGTPLVFLLMYELSYSPRSMPTTSAPRPPQIHVAPIDPPGNSDVRPNGFPKPKLLGSEKQFDDDPIFSDLPGATAKTAMIPDSLKALLGRWVVVSSEGASLDAPTTSISASESSPGGPMGPAVFRGADPMGMGGAGGMAGGASPSTTPGPPLQWIEFASDRVVLFDGRESKVVGTFDAEKEPKQLRLLRVVGTESQPTARWRNGIFRLERDRLIICWTTGSRPPPTDFTPEDHYETQLLILRREWNPPEEYDPKQTPPPLAVVPFTETEAVRLQQSWAAAIDGPVQITNSLGISLVLIPPGAFDPLQQELIASGFFSGLGSHPAVPRPLYMSQSEVTVGQFRQFADLTGYQTSSERAAMKPTLFSWRNPGIVQDNDKHPVVHVSWQDAQAFCRWLSETTHTPYRLPTLGEFAFATRVGLGVESRIRPPQNARLKFFDTTAPIGGDSTNLFGLNDLFGNVSEWTQMAAENRSTGYLVVGGSFRHSLTNSVTVLGKSVQHATAWLVPRQVDDTAHFDDVGFRVVRVVGDDAIDLTDKLPSVQDLTATASRLTLKEPNRLDGPIVVVRGLFPTTSLPLPFECHGFDIERAESNLSSRDTSPPSDSDWRKLDLSKTLKLLESSDFALDPVNAMLTDPVFTMRLPARTDAPWPKELVTHPLLPLTAPKTKYEVQLQLTRFIDFEVTPGHSYSYRVRLKLKPVGQQEKPTINFTPWSSNSPWVAVEKLPSN